MVRSSTVCPYVGLQPYTEDDREFFFGRENDLRIISSNLYAAPLTILYGASGVGKSSVLLAGVVPHLRAAARTVAVVFNAWQDPSFLSLLKSRCIESAELVTTKPLTIDAGLPLDDILLKIGHAAKGCTLIMLDQFEEYFLYNPESAARTSFEREFARTVNRDDVDANFLIVLREDALSKLDRFRARIPSLMANTLRLQHLDVKAAKDAIRMPLSRYNERQSDASKHIAIEDALVEKIIEQVETGQVTIGQSGRGQAGADSLADTAARWIETPFLQLVLTRLWNEEINKNRSRVLRLKTLERLGGADKIVRAYLDDKLAELKDAEREVCSRLFDRLVTRSGTKVALLYSDLVGYAGDLAEVVDSVLEILGQSRIIRTVPASLERPGETRYEIFHDVLSLAVLDWRTRYLQEKERNKEVEAVKREVRYVIANLDSMRRMIGIFGILLPYACILASSWQNAPVLNSIGAYYYSNIRDIFIGLLLGTSLALFMYKGYELRDQIIASASSIAVLGFAIFPSPSPVEPLPAVGMFQLEPPYADLLHSASFFLFFLLSGYNSYFVFTLGERASLTKRKIVRNRVYRACGFGIFASLALIILGAILGFRPVGMNWTFMLESVMFQAFGISWLVKGKTFFRDKPFEKPSYLSVPSRENGGMTFTS